MVRTTDMTGYIIQPLSGKWHPVNTADFDSKSELNKCEKHSYKCPLHLHPAASFNGSVQTFDEAALCETLKKNVSKSGYVKPTPVQKHGIPIISAGRDMMACAQTGSGKTVRSKRDQNL